MYFVFYLAALLHYSLIKMFGFLIKKLLCWHNYINVCENNGPVSRTGFGLNQDQALVKVGREELY